jgi:hypothetical protein
MHLTTIIPKPTKLTLVPLKRKSEVDLTNLVDLTNEDDDSVQITRTITRPPIEQPIPVCLGMINTFLLESSSTLYEFDKDAKKIDNWYNLKVAITQSSTKNGSNLYFYHLNGKLVKTIFIIGRFE